MILPTLIIALVAISACSKTKTANTTNEVTVNETDAEKVTPVDANATVNLNATGKKRNWAML